MWLDSINDLNSYAGRFQNGMMVLTGKSEASSGDVTPVRMTYQLMPDGSVVQTGYMSNDSGASWTLRYKFIYRRSAQP